jgi:ADP-heptose:LPS heptosyltransferase
VDSGDPTDLLFTMPFVESVRQNFASARLGLLCDERTSHLALSSGAFQDIVVYDSEQLRQRGGAAERLREILRAEEWEIAVLVGQRYDSARAELALASNARLRLGPASDDAFPEINCEISRASHGRHACHSTATWGRLLGAPSLDSGLVWPLAEDMRRQIAQLVHFNKPRKDQLLIGVDPGVAKSGTLLAPENLAFLINHLAGSISSKTIVLSFDSDAARIDGMKAALRGEKLELPRPTLRETTILAGECDLFISGNSDLFHFAVAMGVPSLAIFTEADGEQWIPPSGRFELLHSVEGERLSLSELTEKIDRLLAG